MKLFIGIPHSLNLKKKRGANQTLIVMRLIILIMALCYFRASAIANAQGISLNVKKASLESVFEQIKLQSGYSFWYKDNALDHAEKITLNIKNAGLKQTLDLCFRGQPLTYEIVEKTIVVKEKVARPNISPEKRQTDINGKVTDSTGRPLSGATVKVKNSDLITSTNEQGIFILKNVPDGAMLQIMYIGYKTRELTLSPSDNNLIIKMTQDVSSLQEISILSTGYQNIPLERATGSFSKVDNKTYNREVSTDVISRLKAIAPSLLIDERSGKSRLSIRGRSTILANDQPLIVLDNFPYDGDIRNINPNDVEDVTILKDAAAASIWGVRAGNGVIVITTKKGKLNSKPLVSMNSNVSIGERPDIFYQPKMSSTDFIDLETRLFKLGFYDASLSNTTTRPVVSPAVELLASQRSGAMSASELENRLNILRGNEVRNDLSQYLYRTTVAQQYAVNLRGGTESYTYYFSGGFDRSPGQVVGNGYDRIALNAQQQFTPFKNFTISSSLVYTQSNAEIDNTLSDIRLSTSQQIYPYARLADDNGQPIAINKNYRNAFVDQSNAQGFLNWNYMPLDDIGLNVLRTQLNNIRASTGLRYSLFEGLDLDVKYQYERQISLTKNLQDENSYFVRDLVNRYSSITGTTITRNIPTGAVYNFSNTNLSGHNGRAQLSYSKTFGNHNITAIGGYEVRQVVADGSSSRLYGYDALTGTSKQVNYSTSIRQYPLNNSAAIPGVSGISYTIDRFRSYFVNASYTYLKRYTISGSGRIDQSNLFGVQANQRSVPLYSTGIKWAIDKEPFYSLAWLPSLSLRATYGFNGNYDNTVTAFTTARSSTSAYTQQPAANIFSPANSNLRWERSRIINLGLDFASRDNRISGSLEFFTKRGIDLIGNGPIESTSGFTTFKGNVASMKGSGADILIKTKNIDHTVSWTTDFQFSYATDKITKYETKPTVLGDYFLDASINGFPVTFTPTVGKPLFSIYSLRNAGLDPLTGDPRGFLKGIVSKDYTAILNLANSPIDSLVYNGRALPPVIGAIRNTIGFHGFSFSFNISYRLGYYFRRPSISYSAFMTSYASNKDYALRWQNPGDENNTNVPSFVYPANNNRDTFYNNSEVLVEKGDNIRFQDLSISYSFNKGTFRWLPFRQAEIYTYVNNVGLLWTANKQHIDPDYPAMPLPRIYSFGLRFNP